MGPNLHGLVGRQAGLAEGYAYTDANKNSGITWTEAELDDYLKDPRMKIPGTRMVRCRDRAIPSRKYLRLSLLWSRCSLDCDVRVSVLT